MNQEFNIADHLASLSDAELTEATKTAQDDLGEAVREQPNSERHQECFAGLVIYTREMQKRGLKLVTVH